MRCGVAVLRAAPGCRHPRSVSAGRGTVIAGGGTGGHIVPSLQIARALVDAWACGRDASTSSVRGGARRPRTWPDAGVPLHAAARPGRAPEPSTPATWLANAGAVAGAGVGVRPRRRRLRDAPATRGGHRGRLRQLSGRRGRGGDAGAPGVRDHRRRAGGGQRPPGPFRCGQRRGLRRDGAAPGPRHRYAGAARTARPGHARPRPRAAEPERTLGLPTDRQTVAVGGGLAGRPPDQLRGGGTGLHVVGRRPVVRSTTSAGRRDFDAVRPAGRRGATRRGKRRAGLSGGALRGAHARPLPCRRRVRHAGPAP